MRPRTREPVSVLLRHSGSSTCITSKVSTTLTGRTPRTGKTPSRIVPTQSA